MGHGGLMGQQHGGGAEHVAEGVVHQIKERGGIQIGITHHLKIKINFELLNLSLTL